MPPVPGARDGPWGGRVTLLDNITVRRHPIHADPQVNLADFDALLAVAQAATDPWLVGHLADHHATKDNRFSAGVYAVYCGECEWDNPNPKVLTSHRPRRAAAPEPHAAECGLAVPVRSAIEWTDRAVTGDLDRAVDAELARRARYGDRGEVVARRRPRQKVSVCPDRPGCGLPAPDPDDLGDVVRCTRCGRRWQVVRGPYAHPPEPLVWERERRLWPKALLILVVLLVWHGIARLFHDALDEPWPPSHLWAFFAVLVGGALIFGLYGVTLSVLDWRRGR